MEFLKLRLKDMDVNSYNLTEAMKEQIRNTYPIVFKNSLDCKVVIGFAVTKSDLNGFKDVCDDYSDSEDIVFWLIYPKGTSKQYKKIVEINRDSIWEEMLETEIRPVSLVSLSNDLSCMRLRFHKYVKTNVVS